MSLTNLHAQSGLDECNDAGTHEVERVIFSSEMSFGVSDVVGEEEIEALGGGLEELFVGRHDGAAAVASVSDRFDVG